jgi:hypothetical protein
MVVDACLGGWSGEIAGGQAPFGAWRGDACRRLRTCGPCRESRCSARPASAPRLRAQHGRRHSVLSLSPAPRVGPPVLCTSTPVCRAPSPPRHATWRPRQRQSRASGFFFPACAPCRPRFRYDEGWTTRSHGPRRAWRFRTPAGSPRRSPRVARATEKLGSQRNPGSQTRLHYR